VAVVLGGPLGRPYCGSRYQSGTWSFYTKNKGLILLLITNEYEKKYYFHVKKLN
jgi:hypothetical protein